ncbi:hypothetical protein ABBQ32_002146 [Trebouxia sp. C0010 RCD-2024]
MQQPVPTSVVLDEVLVASADRASAQHNNSANCGAGRRSDDPESQEASASPLLRVPEQQRWAAFAPVFNLFKVQTRRLPALPGLGRLQLRCWQLF